jgi:hypothetical protein
MTMEGAKLRFSRAHAVVRVVVEPDSFHSPACLGDTESIECDHIEQLT